MIRQTGTSEEVVALLEHAAPTILLLPGSAKHGKAMPFRQGMRINGIISNL
jgi:hypothetical protein